MKILKIAKIENVGSFSEFNDNSTILDNNNIIYALNGYGKTTLTSIFWSLKENNPDYIIGRKNLNAQNMDKINIVIKCDDNKTYLHTNGYWHEGGQLLNNKNPEIIIFDDEFISNNIFSEKFEIEHKKALYRIIFGERGIELSKDLTTLRKKKKEFVKDIELLQDKLNPKYYSISQFLELKEADFDIVEINRNLIDINKKIKNSIDSSKISKKTELTILPYIEINHNLFFLKLKQKVNSEAHLNAKRQIDKFKEQYFKNIDEYEQFIKIGFDNHKDYCPFCHKKLDDETLLDTYKNYFDKSYEKIKIELQRIINIFKAWNLDSEIYNLNYLSNRNCELAEEWKEYFKISVELTDFQIADDLRTLKEQIDDFSIKKLKNLNIEPDKELLLKFKECKIKLNCSIRNYNKIVKVINKEIQSFKENLLIYDTSELDKEKNKIFDINTRFSVDIKDICTKIRNKESELNKVETKIGNKITELDNYSQNINSEYLDIINKKLKDDLHIKEFKLKAISKESKATAKDAYVEIYLEMLNKEIALYSYKNEKPSFKNTLGRGDKNSLAFAFFLAFMEKKKDLENVCLIFDDPLSSHDENRQDQTAFVIMKLAKKVSQTFVLTHKKSFVRALFERFKTNAKYLEINKTEHTGSVILSLEKDKIIYKDEFEKIIDKFNEYLTNNTNSDLSIGNLKNDIRKVFEKVLRTKYYDILKDCSFSITSYTHLDEYFFKTQIITGNNMSELTDLAQISNIGSHFTSYDEMNPEEIKVVLERTLNLIKKL